MDVMPALAVTKKAPLLQGDLSQDAWSTVRGYKNLAYESVQVGTDDHGTPDDPADDTPIMGPASRRMTTAGRMVVSRPPKQLVV